MKKQLLILGIILIASLSYGADRLGVIPANWGRQPAPTKPAWQIERERQENIRIANERRQENIRIGNERRQQEAEYYQQLEQQRQAQEQYRIAQERAQREAEEKEMQKEIDYLRQRYALTHPPPVEPAELTAEDERKLPVQNQQDDQYLEAKSKYDIAFYEWEQQQPHPVGDAVRANRENRAKAQADAIKSAQDEKVSKLFMFRLEQADKGMPTSQYNLGIMYLNGQGCETNVTLGMHYIRMAATNGCSVAVEYLKTHH